MGMKTSKCYCCKKEIPKNELGFVEFSTTMSDGKSDFNIKYNFTDSSKNEIVLCKACVVGSIVVTAQTLTANDFII
jgi:hypothetical protein